MDMFFHSIVADNTISTSIINRLFICMLTWYGLAYKLKKTLNPEHVKLTAFSRHNMETGCKGVPFFGQLQTEP